MGLGYVQKKERGKGMTGEWKEKRDGGAWEGRVNKITNDEHEKNDNTTEEKSEMHLVFFSMFDSFSLHPKHKTNKHTCAP